MYICIDLKSFYASAECAERGLDPFTVNLVVADPSRGKGALCLAVTPAMKSLGIRNRCRLFEIPGHVKYRIVRPHMRKYMEISAQIYGIYLKYILKRIFMSTPLMSALLIWNHTINYTAKRQKKWHKC